MLINVFKGKVSRKFGDFRIHCMMDEIGKLHPQNVKGILDFGNARNFLLSILRQLHIMSLTIAILTC